MKNKNILFLAIGLILAPLMYNYASAKISAKISSMQSQYFSAGERAGRMAVLSELVECESTTNTEIIAKYLKASHDLEVMGELDSSPYPCE